MRTLKESLSADFSVDEVIHKLSNPENRKKVVVWVEGKDWRIYRDFFNPEKIVESGESGCNQIVNGHRKLKALMPSMKSIVIVDADFNRREGMDLDANPDIFYTDGHDVEMMMMMSEKVRLGLCRVFEYTGDCEHFFDEVFHDLHFLSYFKWYDHHHQKCYSYEPLSKVQQSQKNLKNIEWIENQLRSCSKSKWEHSNHDTPFVAINVDDVEKFIQEHTPVDRYEITNGHDFCNRLCLHIKNIQSEKKYVRDEDSLKDSVISLYDKEQFQKTNLHRSLRSWSEENVDILS